MKLTYANHGGTIRDETLFLQFMRGQHGEVSEILEQ